MRAIVLGISFLFCSVGSLYAEGTSLPDRLSGPLDPWHIAGENHFQYDYYDARGDETLSNFPFKSNQVYNETRLSMDRQFSLYETFKISFSGLLTGSEYRSTDQGWVFEDVRATWQKGNGVIPFRLDGGDYTANLSYRTIQQNLKGVQVEFQPPIEFMGIKQKHSIIGFSGMGQNDWRNIDFDRDLFNGGSWLVDLARFGVWAFHVVHNHRQKDLEVTPGFSEAQDQVTWSFTFEKVFNVLKQSLSVQAEVAKFVGDFQSGSAVNYGESDTGIFVKVDGSNNTPLTYGFRYESYGDNFQPHGGVISPNRQTLAWTAGWQFEKGLRLDGRIEKYIDNFESSNQLDTNVYGLSFSGPVENPWLHDLQIYTDIAREGLDDDSRTNVKNWTSNGDLSASIYKEWAGHFGYSVQNSNNIGFGYLTINRQFIADVGHPISFWGGNGSAKVGSVWRRNSGISGTQEYGPTFLISFSKGHHSVDYNTQALWQDAVDPMSSDVSSFSHSGGYNFTYGIHRIRIDFEIHNRNPSEFVKHSEDYRFGVSYTLSFDKPADVDIRDFSWKEGYRPLAAPVLEEIRAEVVDSGAAIFEGVRVGQPLEEAVAFLEKNGIKGAAERQNFLIYETRIFKGINYRQRFIIEHDDKVVVRSIVVIDLSPGSDARNAERPLEDVRGIFLKRFGNPSGDIREGEFSPAFRDDINSDRLIRLMEWQGRTGGSVRLGVPHRIDQQVRIEIQKAATFPPIHETKWSLESAG